ncbi:YwaF family protein [Nocardioides bizhenqiangii]|uniref:TIGR02206 family membrane protein n=1 Tax=Nocardioides bizhenqiangii TaxID=3095076 RepID=A0ABZ0ZKP8_9ACTN|nr:MULTISPECIES: TIGR02206 family membrane protein [unclassified Nocardioides]MDZ5620269.1 TIGR02206 family membrane protein [Nocardioides sp. HM23]WQQ24645.1 TIGR02206 family membrane protein [Nocardioides sp. HM61]
MSSYGPTHLVPLVLFVIGLVAAVWLGRQHRAVDGPTRFSRAAAVLVPLATVPFLVIDLIFNFDIAVTLPLHLCDLAWIAASWALWTHKPFPVALTFFWGLTLTIQGVITPALGEDIPHPRYFAFWALHLLIVWAAVYLVIGLGKVPRWRDYGTTVATTLGWAAATYCLNLVADTNYGYLMRKPRSSILDFFGPWPWYVVQEIALIVAVWALMTWVAQRSVKHPSRGSRRPRARSLPS